MALTFPSSPSAFPPFSCPSLNPLFPSLPPFTVYLSRWNNGNAEPFSCRRHRRFSSVLSILPPSASSSPSTTPPDLKSNRSSYSRSAPSKSGRFSKDFESRKGHADSDSTIKHPDLKSNGSSSYRSASSKSGRFSKYSKPRKGHTDGDSTIKHPAFKPIRSQQLPPVSAPDGEDGIRVTEKGVTYKLKDAPFEFQYSYTEAPKVMYCTLDTFQLELISASKC
jgi:hypothetical protein